MWTPGFILPVKDKKMDRQNVVVFSLILTTFFLVLPFEDAFHVF